MKPLQSKFFAFPSILVIAALVLAGCASAPPTVEPTPVQPTAVPTPVQPTQAPTQTPEMPTMQIATPTEAASGAEQSIDPLVFQQAMRKLWEDHVTWTRVYIISALADLPETDTAATRLLQNQEDIGQAVASFYGDPAGEQLTALLKDHILTAAALVAAAKAGDTAKFETTNASWYKNADEIAAFLNGANPEHWPLDEMKAMMKSHLDLTLTEVTARLNADWTGDVAAYDKVHDGILSMADMLSQGIIQQFPEKFAQQNASQSQIDLTLAMNKLWEDHITWTRVYIMSVTSGLPDEDAAATRLLQNQVDIGDALKGFYGDVAGEQLTGLLKDHILGAVELLAAAKAGDNAKFEDAKQRWYNNADEISAFLSSANPDNWQLDDMKAMMKSHLDLTLEEATARLNADWTGDVAAYDKVHAEILDMAGMLTSGILAQFPVKFD